MKNLITVLVLFLVSCGSFHNEPGSCTDADGDGKDTAKDCFEAKKLEREAAEKAAAKAVIDAQMLTIKGSVSPAFEVVVDGTPYSDMEDYFSWLNDALPDLVADAGYVGFNVKLKASIGYQDLTNGMSVFIQGDGDRGYQGKTTLDQAGNFAATFPPDGAGSYKIKATKRISVVLTKPSEVKTLCYNFNAVDLRVPFAQADKPLILKSFTSSLTSYACDSTESNQGFQVPAGPKTATATSTSTVTSTATATSTVTSTATGAGTSTQTSTGTSTSTSTGTSTRVN